MSQLTRSAAPPVRSAAVVPVATPLRTNFAWTLVGNLIYAVSHWAIIVLLTKIGSPDLVGEYALALAITGPLFTLASLQLRSIQAADATGQYEFGEYLALRFFTTTCVVLVVAGMACLGGFPRTVAIVIVACGAARAIEAVADVFLGLFQRHERMDLVAQSTMLKGILAVAGFAAGFLFTHDLGCAMAGLALMWLVAVLSFDVRWSSQFVSPISLRLGWTTTRRLLQLAGLALPLGVGSVLAALEVSVPRCFIERQWGTRELGIFAALASMAAAGAQVINALGQSAAPRLARLIVTNRHRDFLRLIVKLVAIGLSVGLAGVGISLLWGDAILTLCYGPEYGGHADVLSWLMAAAAVMFGHVFLGNGLNALGAFRPRVPVQSATLLVVAVGCALLGPPWGLQGIAWSICGAQVLAAGLYGWVFLCHWVRRIRPERAEPV